LVEKPLVTEIRAKLTLMERERRFLIDIRS